MQLLDAKQYMAMMQMMYEFVWDLDSGVVKRLASTSKHTYTTEVHNIHRAPSYNWDQSNTVQRTSLSRPCS